MQMISCPLLRATSSGFLSPGILTFTNAPTEVTDPPRLGLVRCLESWGQCWAPGLGQQRHLVGPSGTPPAAALPRGQRVGDHGQVFLLGQPFPLSSIFTPPYKDFPYHVSEPLLWAS